MNDRTGKPTGNGRMDDQQFSELYEKYANDVLRFSYFYLGDRQQAEDVTQDVFVRLLTHPDAVGGHNASHILGAEALREASGAPIYASAMEKDLLLDPELNTSNQIGRSCRIKADHYLIDGESVTAAGITLKMILTPGHTEGSCCYFISAEESGGDPILLSGDTLFEESVGRTDLPTGDTYDLTESIRTKLYVLPDNTAVYSGHTGPTTIGHEKKYNYFVHE